MRSIDSIALATMFFLNSVDVGLAQEDCIKCSQNYFYICAQNHGECIEACSSIGTTDKNACRRRCAARNEGCGKRAALKDMYTRALRYSRASAYSVTGGHGVTIAPILFRHCRA